MRGWKLVASFLLGLGCLLCAPDEADAQGAVYFSDIDGRVGVLNTATGSLRPVGSLPAQGIDIQQIIGIAYDANRDRILLLAGLDQEVYTMDPATGDASLLFTAATQFGGEFQGGAIFNDTLYGINRDVQKIEGFRLSDFERTVGPGLRLPQVTRAMGIQQDGNLFTADRRATIQHVNPDGTQGAVLQTILLQGIPNLEFGRLTLDADSVADGWLFALDDFDGIRHIAFDDTETIYLSPAEINSVGVEERVTGVATAEEPPTPTIADLAADVEDLIDDPGTPPAAQGDLKRAIQKLEKAQEKLDEGDLEKAVNEMARAAKELEQAAALGADTAAVLESLVDLARGLALERRDEALPLAGTNYRVDEELAEMAAELVIAEDQAIEGNEEKAIKAFSKVVKHADGAIANVPHGELGDVTQDVFDLVADPATPAAAFLDLDRALDKLVKAQGKLDDGDVHRGVEEMARAVKELEEAAVLGAITASIQQDLVDLARGIAVVARVAALPLADTNAEVDAELAKMEAEFDKAENELFLGNLERAIKAFAKAVDHAGHAIDRATL